MQHEILFKNLLKIPLPIPRPVTTACPVSHKQVVTFPILLDHSLTFIYEVRGNISNSWALFLLVALNVGVVSWLKEIRACVHLGLSVNLIILIRMIWCVITACVRSYDFYSDVLHSEQIFQVNKMYAKLPQPPLSLSFFLHTNIRPNLWEGTLIFSWFLFFFRKGRSQMH